MTRQSFEPAPRAANIRRSDFVPEGWKILRGGLQQGGEIVGEYSSAWIDMRHNNALNSAVTGAFWCGADERASGEAAPGQLAGETARLGHRGPAGMNRAPGRLRRVVVVVLCVRVTCTLAENDVAGALLQGSGERRVENRPGYRTVRTRIQPL